MRVHDECVGELLHRFRWAEDVFEAQGVTIDPADHMLSVAGLCRRHGLDEIRVLRDLAAAGAWDEAPAWDPIVPFEEVLPVDIDEVFVGPVDLDPSWSYA